MSDQSQALERSTLQKKDRAELITIATAMGGKPGSRIKKADVIDMILELAGVTEPTSEDGAAKDQTPAKDETRADETAKDESSKGETSKDDSAEGDKSQDDKAGDGKSKDDQAQEDRAQEDKAQGDKGQEDKTPESKDDGGKADQDGRSGQGRGRQQQQRRGGQQQQQQQQQSQQQGQQDDSQSESQEPEPGNRRRRRRGRDRQPQDEAFQGEPVEVVGFLDLRDEGYGFLRVNGYLPTPEDVYVSIKQTRQFNLRKGDQIAGTSRPASRNEKNPALLRIDSINGNPPDSMAERPVFDELTPLFPDERLRLETSDDPYNMTARIVDLIAPIGKGQRGLIVAPPKAGKTMVMKQMVRSIETNNPEAKLLVLLVDERPEEVTDMRRWVQNGEVVASTFDRPPEEHIAVAELAIERAKRLVEDGTDVVVVLDGITRLARAYNLATPQSGRVMSGGVDAAALYPPKRFFGAARNVEEGGSLTILATALIETGSRMDEVIFEEFKGTGNMELRLDRRLAEARIYPAIDVESSGTRHEELLFTPKELKQVWKLRRVLSGMAAESGSGASGIELLTDRMRSFKNNDAFLDEIAKAPTGN